MVFSPVDMAVAVASNAKFQEAALKVFDVVYSKIFKSEGRAEAVGQQTINLKPVSPEQQLLVDRLVAIEGRLQSMPSDKEMAFAFSALQAQLVAGQKRLWQIMVPVLVLNFVFLGMVLLRSFGLLGH